MGWKDDFEEQRKRWPKCPDCHQPMGMYTSPCPAAPGGAMSHYCSAKGREVVTHPSTPEHRAFVAGNVELSKANAAKLAEQIDDQGERSAALDRLSRLSPLERLALAARDDDRIGRCVPGDATLVQRVEAAAALLLLEGPEVLLEALRDAGLTVVSLRDLAEPVHTLRAEQMLQAPDDDLLAGFDDPEVSRALAAARARRDEGGH